MQKILLICLGGAVGALLRYFVSQVISQRFFGSFPFGTLVVNLSGCLIIGLLWGFSEIVIIPPSFRIFVFIGMLGAFTTFSTFALENFHLLRDGEYLLFSVNVLVSNIAGIMLVFIGFISMQSLLNALR